MNNINSQFRDTISAARITGKSDEEIRVLVVKLEAARKAAVWGWQ